MANEDFTSAAQEQGIASGEAASGHSDQGISSPSVMAQAATGEPVPVDPVTGKPVAQPEAPVQAAPVPSTVSADANNVVHLPQGVSIDQIGVDGDNLVLVQPDGTSITILNAALKVPTFLIGDVEIPQVALTAALEANGINVAAGPDGSLTVVSSASQSAGGNFGLGAPDIGAAGPVIDLLPPTALQFGRLERPELFPSVRGNDLPELSITPLPGIVNESALDTSGAMGSGGGTTTATGAINVDPGDDGLGSLVVTNYNGQSVDVTNGGTIDGEYGTLTIIRAPDGTYSFEYDITDNTIDHSGVGQVGADDVVNDDFIITLTDGNGDSVSDDLTIIITDDGPAIDLVAIEDAAVVLDETDNDADDGDVGGLLANVTVPGSALFTETAVPGADGEQSKIYSLVLNDGSTGLTDTASGEAVILVRDGDDIVGQTENGGAEVFRISVDTNSGAVTVSQSRALFHDQNPGSDAEAHDESLTPEVMNSGLVSLNVVLTDGDGDTASATAELGSLIRFEDDGPSIEPSGATLPTLVTDDTDITDTTGPVSFAGLFTHDFGADGFKDADDNDAADADAISYALSLKNGNGTDSGLVDTLSGDAILLRVDGNGDIEGYLAGDAGTVAFKIDIDPDTGDVTLTQNRSVVHDDASDPVETGGSAAVMSSDVITLTATITDGDGDQDTASVDIGGAFAFEDDGPSIEPSGATLPTLVTDDTDITDTTGPVSFAGLFTHDFGADSFKDADDNDAADADAISYALSLKGGNGTDSGLVDTLSGDAILLRVDGNGDIEGYLAGDTGTVAFKIDIDPDTGDVTLTQNRSVVHDDASDPVETGGSAAMMSSEVITLTATITDGDGDQDTASVDIGGAFAFEDDGPSIEPSGATLPSLVTDDTDITDTTGPVSFAGLFTHDFGADGFKDADDNDVADADAISYALSLKGGNGTDSGLVDTLSGDAILLRVDGNGDIEGYLAGDTGTVAFKIDIDPDTGDVTLTQNRSVVHDDASDPVETGGSAAVMSSDVITLTATITDGDGDQDTASVDIGGAFAFEDDGPTNNAGTASETVHEDALDNYDPLAVLPGIRGSTGNDEGGKTTTAVFTYATIAALVNFGADGAGAVVLNTDASLEGTAIAGVTSQGDTLAWHVDGNVIQGVASDGRVVFTITQTAGTGTIDPTDDEFTFELLDQVDHIPLNAPSGDDDASAVIDISNAFRAFDGDGDSIVLDAGLSVAVENDVPVVFVPEHAYVANLGAGPATFDLNFEQAVGADEFGSVRFINITTGVTQLRDAGGELVTSGGEPITLVLNAGGTALTGYVNYGEVGQTQVLTVTINPDDTYTVDLDAPLDDGTVMATFNPYTQGDNPGNYLFNEVNDLPLQGSPVLLDVLISGTNSSGNLSSANVSQSGTGVGSQSISQDATLRLDFAEEFVRSNIGPNSGNFTVSNTQLVTSVAVKITQTGSNDPAVAYVEALNTNFVFSNNIFNSNQASDVSNFLSESTVAITAVVLNGVEYDVGDYANGALLDATHRVYYVTSGSDVVGVYVTELNVGDTVGVATSDGFSRFAITNGEGDPIPGGVGTFDTKDYGNFDIGDVSFRTDGQEGQPIDLSLDVRGTDYDGDTVDSTLDFTVVPNDAHHIVGTSGDDIGVNALEGTTGDDLLAGLAGNDVLYGFGGNDLLIGGEGADTLYGGIGENTYDLTDNDNAVDTVVIDPAALSNLNPEEIIGFGSEDVVDLTELFTVDPNGGTNVDQLSDFVRVDGNNLQVDTDGGANGTNWVTVAHFDVTPPASVNILYDEDGTDTSGSV